MGENRLKWLAIGLSVLILLALLAGFYVMKKKSIYNLEFGRRLIDKQDNRVEIALRVGNNTGGFITGTQLLLSTNIKNPDAYIVYLNNQSLLELNQLLSKKERSIQKIGTVISGDTYNVGWNVYKPHETKNEGSLEIMKFSINPKETPEDTVLYLVINGEQPQPLLINISQQNNYFIVSENRNVLRLST